MFQSNNLQTIGRLSMENLKCPGCKRQYTDANPPRLLTMCGHTYCQLCIKLMIKRKDYRFQIRCPQDKMKLTVDSQTVSQFPKNMVLIEHLNKHRPKTEIPQDKNQFLPSFGGEIVSSHKRYESKDSLTNSMFGSKRASLQEGMCLLHQKPLDITCLQQKVQICAECALFGVHKGHTFTTIKDLQIKRNQWIHSISRIMQEKKSLLQKYQIENIKRQVNSLLLKKKASLFEEIGLYFNRIKGMLQKRQNELKSLIDDEIKKTEVQLSFNVKMEKRVEQQFFQWQSKILETVDCLQSQDVMKSLDFFSDLIMQKQENLILKGQMKINDLKLQIERYWLDIEKKIQFPKLKVNEEFQQEIKKSVLIVTALSQMFSKVYASSSLSIDIPHIKEQLCSSQIEEVSLLDITDNFKNQNYYSTIVDTNFDKSILMESSFLQNAQQSMETIDILPKTLQKVKSNQCLFSSSIAKNTNKRTMFRSPKNQRLNTQMLSKAALPANTSPIFMKNKLKRSIFKVKDPERFERILQALELDNLEIVDFTGLQMGDQIVRQVCLKLKQCSKVRSLRLMKNQLSDESIPSLLAVISGLEVLNLAQNSLTVKFLQELMLLAKSEPVKKIKSIQLGQNTINPRKIKQKIQQLKRYGYFISL